MPRSPAIAILTYHSLDDSGSVLSTRPQLFAEQMRLLHELNVRVVSLAEVRRALQGAAPLAPMVALTFDDGFQSVYEHGFPILQRYGFPATVFVVTDYCGKINSWPGQPAHIERRPLLGWSAVREMSTAGVDCGCHTRTHPNLRRIARDAVEEELVASKQALEDAIGRPVETFAYPYGAYDPASRLLAQTHFTLACSARLGFVRAGGDLFALERLDAYYLRSPMLFRYLFRRGTEGYIRFRRGLRELKQLAMG
jgi:peptidoglycan/xylan/chitin deacetylase (PgdA/CDA1 family)